MEIKSDTNDNTKSLSVNSSGTPQSQLLGTGSFETIPESLYVPPADADLQRVFGDYELHRKLGSGGMGIVYLARQRSADRLVALKLIRPERLEVQSPQKRAAWIARFRAEAKAAAHLEHDYVVTVYDVGELNGTLYYSMRYIEGQSLADVVRGGPLENRRAALLIMRVARAVEHAHQLGILHRDLKPQNILVHRGHSGSDGGAASEFGSGRSSSALQTLSDERPFVADFGLAKWLEDDSQQATRTGEVMGTPSYMSPEQAQDASRCTPASDVYSLGATLYDLLTGRPPFKAPSPLETLRQVIDQNPAAPRDLNRAIDRDLETITLKALAKEPSRRYATAGAMADDLRRYINGEPIQARPIGFMERFVRWCRRNPAIAVLGASVAGLLLVVALGSVAYSIRTSRHAEREREARTEAEQYLRVTLAAIDEMLSEVGEQWLSDVPQMEPVRKELLQKALNLHQQLLNSKPTHATLQLEFARAQHRMGDIYQQLGEHEQAKLAFTEAIRMGEQLRANSDNNSVILNYLAMSHSMLGELFRKTAPPEADRHFDAALRLQRALYRRSPDDVELRRELGKTLNNRGLLFTETAQYAKAELALNETIGLLRELADRPDAAKSDVADLGRSQINLGVLLRQQPQRSLEAEVAYKDAIANLQLLHQRYSDNREYQFRLAIAALDLANLMWTNAAEQGSNASGDEKRQQALHWSEFANQKLSEICQKFPGFPLYWSELANSHNSLANVLAGLSRFEEAKTQFDEANQVLDQLADKFPEYPGTVAEYQSRKGMILGCLGAIEFQVHKDAQAAKPYIEQAIVHQTAAARLAPNNPLFPEKLSQHQDYLAQILTELGFAEEAANVKQQASDSAAKAKAMKTHELRRN